jgi:hypothetical protein
MVITGQHEQTSLVLYPWEDVFLIPKPSFIIELKCAQSHNM